MSYFIISIFVITILLMLNWKRISTFFENQLEQQEIDFKERTNLDLWKLTKISPGITWVGIDQFQFSNPEFYFDEEFLYIIDHTKVIKHNIKNIMAVKRTIYTRNDRRIWEIVINENDNNIVNKIATNNSLTTANFGKFLDKVNENPDSVVDSEWLL